MTAIPGTAAKYRDMSISDLFDVLADLAVKGDAAFSASRREGVSGTDQREYYDICMDAQAEIEAVHTVLRTR